MQQPLLPLTDDELRSVVGADYQTDIIEKIREAITHDPGHRHDSKRNVWAIYGASTVR